MSKDASLPKVPALWVTLLSRSQDADIPALCSSDVVANDATSLNADLLHRKCLWWEATCDLG